MRCDCCDKLLTDFECSIKHSIHGYYLNTCRKCLQDIGIPWKGNKDLVNKPNEEENTFSSDDWIDLLDLGEDE